MKSVENCVLAINGGSSSIKFALFQINATLTPLYHGEIEGIGTANTKLSFKSNTGKENVETKIKVTDHNSAATTVMDWLEEQQGFNSVKAIGHRIVQGMSHTEPELISDSLLNELKQLSAFDPEHLPGEIQLIEAFKDRLPSLPQVACFDTSFHTSMPPVAKLLAIPRRYYTMGVHRYGFHGLSYSYLLEELKQIAGQKIADSKIIMAHLGSGASLAAIKHGKCLDTSMGFSPSSGLPMGTRTGDLDPGVAMYLMQVEKLDTKQFSRLINHESGLAGISETSSDMRDLLQIQNTDTRAAEAVEFFCYQTKKWIGSFATVLEGLDTLVFSGGIGENAAEVRKRICEGLQFLGIEIDETKNLNHEEIISTGSSKVCVRIIRTNEELMIARLVCEKLKFPIKK